MSLPRMSWHIGDYHKDTGHLYAADHGAYFLLCMHYWATGGLPDDDRQLAGIARMSAREWKIARPIIEPLFKGEGKWKHKRVEEELVDAQAKYEKRVAAGKKGGKAKAKGKQSSSNATAEPYQPITDNPKEEDSEPRGSADPRADLFGRGLKALAGMTGKTPDSCRALVGRWLKTVDDEAIQILGAIDDAERNRVADPVGWITKSLQPRSRNEQANPNSVVAAQQKLIDKIAEFGPRPSLIRGATGENIVRMLPQGGRERPGDVHGGDNGDPGGILGGDNPARHGPKDGDSPKN